MRKFVVGLMACALGASFGTAVQAQDAGPAVHDWSGLYAGVVVGKLSNDATADNITFNGTPADLTLALDVDGLTGGVTAGGNVQFGNLVFGLEGDASASDAEGSYVDTTDLNFGLTASITRVATLRGRIGVAFDKVLLYGTAGAMSAQVDGRLEDVYNRGTYLAEDSQNYLGWVAGLGAELAVTDHLSVKGEALYHDLGKQTFDFYEGTDGVLNPLEADAKLSGWGARAGLNWKF